MNVLIPKAALYFTGHANCDILVFVAVLPKIQVLLVVAPCVLEDSSLTYTDKTL